MTTAADGKRYRTKWYNLDLILAVGYRVHSPRGTQFRQWATTNLREFLAKGFVMDDARLKNPAAWDYFDELLERIRDIRASEKRFYQKVRDLWALAVDSRIFATTQSPLPTSSYWPHSSAWAIAGEWTGHGFRSLAMGVIKERLGYRHEVVDGQLSHVSGDTYGEAYEINIKRS